MEYKSIIGALDIGSLQVRCVLAIYDENSKIQIIGYATEVCKICQNGIIINNEQAVQAIAAVVEKVELMAGREINSFYINAPSNLCTGVYSSGIVAVEKNKEVDIYDIDRVMEISQSVSIAPDQEIIHNIPLNFNIDGMKIDEPLGANGVRLEANVYLINCLKSCRESYSKVLERTGYELQDLVNENICATEVVLTPEEKKNGAVVIEIGYEKTSVIFYSNNSANYIDSIKVGGKHVTSDIAYALKTNEEEAEDIKKRHGISLESEIIQDEIISYKLLSFQKIAKVSKRIISRIIETRMEEIFNLIKSKLNNVENFNFLNNVYVLTGGGARLSSIDDLAAKIFDNPCRIGTPLNFSGLNDKVNRPDYATVLGLIQYAFLGSKSELEKDTEVLKSKKSISKMKKYLKKFFT